MRIFLILFFLTGFAHLAAAAETGHAVTAPPACINNLEEPVMFEDRKSGNGAFAAGMARRDEDGQPVVYRVNFHRSPPAMQVFIDLHECAHHQTGDIDRPHPPRNSPEHLMNESIADCIAILRIRDEAAFAGISFDDVAEALTNDMAKAGFPEISISSRVSNISNCHQHYPSATSFTNGVLRERGLK